jgi:hypothetical protein
MKLALALLVSTLASARVQPTSQLAPPPLLACGSTQGGAEILCGTRSP